MNGGRSQFPARLSVVSGAPGDAVMRIWMLSMRALCYSGLKEAVLAILTSTHDSS